ncbi:MAG: molybdate ABC transporter substrate-binding protein [Myxococcaceae bacterium]
MRRLVFFLLLLGLSAHARAPSVLVFAAASTADGIAGAAHAYEEKTGVKVETSFAGTNELLRQIKAGAPADLFLAADVASVDALEKDRKLSRSALLSNVLVVIVPAGSSATSFSAEWLQSVKHLSIADPSGVPAGKYAKAWLEKIDAYRKVQPNLIPALDVRAALAAVESGRAEAGIVYATDAASSSRVRVLHRVPEDQAPKITYTLCKLGSSDQAEALFRFLQSDEGLAQFTRLGFRPAK